MVDEKDSHNCITVVSILNADKDNEATQKGKQISKINIYI